MPRTCLLRKGKFDPFFIFTAAVILGQSAGGGSRAEEIGKTRPYLNVYRVGIRGLGRRKILIEWGHVQFVR